MKKRITACLLALIMVFALLPTAAFAKNTYDPAKAIAWATNRSEFDKFPGKCASFVSRCLREGGLTDVKYSTPGDLVSYLEKNNYGTTYQINDANLKKLKAGDVVMVYCSKGHDSSKYWGLHTIFVTAVDQSGKKFTYCAKNSDRFCETKSFSYLKNYASYFECSRCGSAKNSVGVFVSMNAGTPAPKQQYTMAFNANGGSGSMGNIVVTEGTDFSLPVCSFTRDGWRCIGWNVRRDADNTWYVPQVGWLAEKEITAQGYEKRCYPNDNSTYYRMDSSWTKGCSSVSTYTFFAVWEKEAHVHHYFPNDKPATCTEAGYQMRTCACGDSVVEATFPPLGHDWDSGVVTKEPTATEAGIKTFTCTRCGATKTETISAADCPSAGFTDVPGEGNWAHAGIDYCVANGLMSGVGDGLFAPKMTTTRAQIVQILYNLAGEPQVSGTTPFTDLTQNWYKDAVLWAYQNGVVSGTSDTTFAPNLPVTREQIAVILMGYAEKVLGVARTWTPADLSGYPDAGSVSGWAKSAMADAVALGLISGTTSGGQTYLNPQGSATREQVATILKAFCENVKK